jgi:cyclophilin family peptidyl-prolyl cis-trans isomerase
MSAQRGARRRRGRLPEPEGEDLEPIRRPRLAVAVGAALTIVTVLAGVAYAAALDTRPASGPLSKCRLARELTPRHYAAAPPLCTNPAKGYYADLYSTKGHIAFVMPASTAPNTVNNFVALAVNGFYNGTAVDRVEDWVVQAGDPEGTGRGGPGYDLPDEASSGAWDPGAVGMARFPGGPVNGSQFFILKAPWPGSGPGSTTFNRFGTVVLGLDIAQQLTVNDRITNVAVRQA